MASVLKLRRGNRIQNNVFTGAEGELSYDSTAKKIRVHDGITLGGKILASEIVSVTDFGAVGDGIADDTLAIQAAINATPTGGTLLFIGRFLISDEIIIDKQMNVCGGGYSSPFAIATTSNFIKQSNSTKSIFKLRARKENYAFDQFGIVGNIFQNLTLSGNSSSDRCVAAITTDTTINGGNYHIRECAIYNVNILYCTTGIDFTGICYLNNFYNSNFSYCTTGFKFARGASSDNGGQNRFFGVKVVLSGTCASLGEDSAAGSYSFFGCTLSESQYGIRTRISINLTINGCEFESLTNSGNGAGIYISYRANQTDLHSYGTITILGNKFITSDNAIMIDKSTTTDNSLSAYFNGLIDSNYFDDTGYAVGLYLFHPTTDLGLMTNNLVFGRSNAGANGIIPSSKIHAKLWMIDERRKSFTKRVAWTGSGQVLEALPRNAYIQNARIYLTANATAFSAGRITLGGTQIGGQIANMQTQALNTWVVIIDGSNVPGHVSSSGNGAILAAMGTGGMSGAVGIIEYEYFIAD